MQEQLSVVEKFLRTAKTKINLAANGPYVTSNRLPQKLHAFVSNRPIVDNKLDRACDLPRKWRLDLNSATRCLSVDKLFEVLGRLQANAVRSAQNKKNKEKARQNGRMLNGTAVYGFKIIRDDKSRPFLVPDWKERKLMSELIRWRDEGFTWAECVTQSRVRKFKNSRSDDGIYRDRTLRRMYESAKAADFAFSEG